jgi:predicted nucleic acid-binding protein
VIGLFDAGFIYILFDDRARVPRDAKGKLVVDRAQDRVDFLVQTISERKDKIILPSPALTEFMLLSVDRYRDYLAIIRRKAVFEIAGYDEPEAIELVEHWQQFGDGNKLKRGAAETYAKLKYDRQIAAIAKTRRVECIYSTDSDLEKYADQLNIKFCNLIHLPLPPFKTAYGFGALVSPSLTGIQNTGFGYNSLNADTTGTDNAAFGEAALPVLTSGSNNIAIGQAAMTLATTASNNTAVGVAALYSVTGGGGSSNTGIGFNALLYNTAGQNSAVGYGGLVSNTSGGFNTALGYNAGYGTSATNAGRNIVGEACLAGPVIVIRLR